MENKLTVTIKEIDAVHERPEGTARKRVRISDALRPGLF